MYFVCSAHSNSNSNPDLHEQETGEVELGALEYILHARVEMGTPEWKFRTFFLGLIIKSVTHEGQKKYLLRRYSSPRPVPDATQLTQTHLLLSPPFAPGDYRGTTYCAPEHKTVFISSTLNPVQTASHVGNGQGTRGRRCKMEVCKIQILRSAVSVHNTPNKAFMGMDERGGAGAKGDDGDGTASR